MLVSAKHELESAIGIHMYSPLEPPSHFLPHPTPLGCSRAPVWVTWVIQQNSIGYFTYGNVSVHVEGYNFLLCLSKHVTYFFSLFSVCCIKFFHSKLVLLIEFGASYWTSFATVMMTFCFMLIFVFKNPYLLAYSPVLSDWRRKMKCVARTRGLWSCWVGGVVPHLSTLGHCSFTQFLLPISALCTMDNAASFYFLTQSKKNKEIFSSVQFSHSVVSDSLWPHESQHVRPPCPSPTPGVYSDSRP